MTLTEISALGEALAKAKPVPSEVTAPYRTQWEIDVLAIAKALPLTGSSPGNDYQREVFFHAAKLNQSPV